MNSTFVRHCGQLINNCPHAWQAQLWQQLNATFPHLPPLLTLLAHLFAGAVPGASKRIEIQSPICYANHFVAAHRLTFSAHSPLLSLSSPLACTFLSFLVLSCVFSLTFPFACTFSCRLCVFYLCAHCDISKLGHH